MAVEPARRLETQRNLFVVMRLGSLVVLSYFDAGFETRCGLKDFWTACCLLLLLLAACCLLLLKCVAHPFVFVCFVLPGGGGDGWCRRHSSTMVTRHYVLWVQQCPRLCTVVSSTVWMTVRGGGRRCVGFGWAQQQVPSPWGENQFKPPACCCCCCCCLLKRVAHPWPLSRLELGPS